MFSYWYLLYLIIKSIQAQSSFDGGGFLPDPFLELTAGVTTPVNQKINKPDSSCISNGALAIAIIATLLLSAFIAFLTWMVYLRQKFKELRAYESREKKYMQPPTPPILKQNKNDNSSNHKVNQYPFDVTDYKFGTFPFRQSQAQSTNVHSNHSDWLNRMPSSFRSVNTDQDTQIIDIELLNPTFCGLNFSITGNMTAGIFIKDILNKNSTIGQNSTQLQTGDRIIALTVCFDSIVYEDALTILSYASPYPVILRVQRPLHSTKVNFVGEKRPVTVKWRDDFDHYDNDTPHNRSYSQHDSSKTLLTELKSTTSIDLSKKVPSPITKGNKRKTFSNTIESITKKTSNANKTYPIKLPDQILFTSTGLSSRPIENISTLINPSNKIVDIKSMTNSVISCLQYRNTNGEYITDATNNDDGTFMPYYDSPYDYYAGQTCQAELNQNNNNNNSELSTEPSNAVTSVYTLELSTIKTNLPTKRTILPRRCERRLSSPAVILPITIQTDHDDNISLENIDTYV